MKPRYLFQTQACRKLVLLFSLFLLCPLGLLAQSNYKPGYVVTLEGDTVHGFINYKEWSNTPAAISFRVAAKSGPDRIYDVSNTRYFEISGLDAYQRYEGPVTMNPVEVEKLSFDEAKLDTATLIENVTVFMRVNYKGEVLDLLSYTDPVKTRFFVQEKDGSQPQELYYKVYYSLRRGVALRRSNGYVGPLLYLVTQKGYVGQLQFLLNKYDIYTEKLNRDVEYAHYSVNDLENLFIKINEMRVSNPAAKYRRRSTTRYFAGAALNSSIVRFSGIRGLDNPASNPVSYMPLVSFGFDAFLNRHIQKFFFRFEGTLTAASFHVENEGEFETDYVRQSYKIALQNVTLSPQLIYSLYNKDNFKFHVGIAGQANLTNYTENHYRVTTEYSAKYSANPPPNKTEDHPEYRKLMPFWASYAFRAGAVVNRQFEFYATYAPYRSVTQHQTSSIEIRTLCFGANYLFRK